MKTERQTLLVGAVAFAAAVTLLVGCATQKSQQAVQQTESMLVAAGFKAIPAKTPEQEQMLKTLPTDRVSAIRRVGKVYFVYPDSAQKVLYVGKNDQYLTYEAKLQEQGLETNDFAAWGDWDAQ